MPPKLTSIAGGLKSRKASGIRAEKAHLRRRHLSEVVIRLIEQRGFDGISVNEVAEHASMSVGGLYRHIDTKNDLLEMVCDEINLGLLDEMKAAAAATRGISAKLEAAMRIYWHRHWLNAPAILVAYREYQSFSEDAKIRYRNEERQLAEFFGDLIRAGVVMEAFRPVDDRLLAYEIIMLSHMRALKGYAYKDRSQDEILTEQLELVFSRLIPQPSAKG